MMDIIKQNIKMIWQQLRKGILQVFTAKGTSIQDLERRIVTDWLPTSGYEYADGPDVEVYLNADPMNMKYEVWIPVVKK